MSAPKMWFKVLVDGKSCHGGNFEWSLPKGEKPGKWQEAEGEPIMCQRGLHLTDWIAAWWKPGCKAYLVEAEGILEEPNENSFKCVAKRVRLIREATTAELEANGVFSSGIHQAKGAKQFIASGSATVRAWDSATVRASGSATVRAWGSATVRASGSATVEAWDSATVRAWDSATVRASGSATVRASGSATVRASGSATVRAWGSATVEAWDSATVRASGSATVRAWGSATVEAWDSATVISWWGSPAVKVLDAAVHVNRSNTKPVIFTAEGASK